MTKQTDLQKKSIVITFRLSAAEHAHLIEAASRAQLPPSTYIRHAVLDLPVKVRSYLRMAPEDVAQLKRIGNLLNQIARALWRGRFSPLLEEHLAAVLAQLKEAISAAIKPKVIR